MKMTDTIRQTIIQFCAEFVADPYLCYTEHGQHALLYSMLYDALPQERRYTTWLGKKLCVIQKEYPTAADLGKSKRQHWDMAILQTPPKSTAGKYNTYDYLRLAAAVELGMNEAQEHLVDDIERLCHPASNLERGFVVHLYRLSKPGALFSDRDWSANSGRILTPAQVAQLSIGKSIEIFYGIADNTGKYRSEAWHIQKGQKVLLENHPVIAAIEERGDT